MVNKLTVTELALLTKLDKSYVSKVKRGIKPPSQNFIDAIERYLELKRPETDYFGLFLKSREAMGVSQNTLNFYKERLSKFVSYVDYLRASRKDIERYLNSIPPNENGLSTRHASFRTIKTLYRWISSEYGLPNPTTGISAPILGKLMLPSLTKEQISVLLDKAVTDRDKAIIALFTESGLRLSELTNIKLKDIDWSARTIQIMGKGRREALCPFGELSERYLRGWLAQYEPKDNIWGLNEWGIASMLKRLEKTTGLPCNPHTFRRTFACLLRKAGVDTMTIKDLGRWESLEMVQRYTRSVNFHDSLKFYKAPLS